MKYNPEAKMYYGSIDADHRLIPAPDITIATELQYSNDSIIGYTYTINFTGKVTALDLRDADPNADIDLNSYDYGIGAVTDHLSILRSILAQNGNSLHIIDNGNEILTAYGGILRSFEINESDNNWYHYADYTATIEFNTIQFIGSTWKSSYVEEDCANPFIDSTSYTKDNAGIADISKYKIKTFSDSWSITFDEQQAFERVLQIENGANLNIDNNGFNLTYTISATGKHFFTNEGKLLPAWENAKNFVQYRLYEQVTNLISNVLKDTGSSCSPPDGLDTLNNPGESGLYKNIGNSNYLVFNEKITCESSEGDGTFSATYNALIKNNKTSSWTLPQAKHKVSKTISISKATGSTQKTVSVKGTIEGLVQGGIINAPQPLSLPNQGAFLIYQNSTSNKYDNAKLLLNNIYSDTDYNSGVGASGKRDLKPAFKNALGITMANVFGNGCPSNPTEDPRTDPPHPISFNLTHDYNGGIITYTAEYSNTACDRKYKEVSIQTSNPTKILAILNVPNSYSCPIIQELGTYTAKKVTVTIRGTDLSDIGQPENINIFSEVDCGTCYSSGYYPVDLPPEDNLVLTQSEYTKNPIDGSYTITLGYICGTEGCSI
jgi:hypothetical protein